MGLPFGYNAGLPEGVKAAWGCRMIASQDGYLDYLGDRAGGFGGGEALYKWLNGGAMTAARERATALLKGYEMRTREAGEFVLYEDGEGRIVGNTNASAGYLYLAAWLYADEPLRTPGEDGEPSLREYDL